MAGPASWTTPRPATLALACACVLIGACKDPTRSPVALCTRVLLREFPDAKLRAASPGPGPHSPRLLFEAEPRDGFPGFGRFACETRDSAHGTLRLESAGLDEDPLSEAELTLINADLLLEDIRAADSVVPARAEPGRSQRKRSADGAPGGVGEARSPAVPARSARVPLAARALRALAGPPSGPGS